ncbi:putative oxidoreductase [Podospora australis]|uniref:Oxidoreductase n=1 Tax=Podospora australis TaxID=1536484 RepID=A0AAN6X0F9_9PEZI|nr:putative oxidoreductase [Podospora australis]
MALLIQEEPPLKNTNGWHPGETAIHSLLRVPTSSRPNPSSPGLPPSYAYRVSRSPLLAIGTLDDQNRPWTSLWGGERGSFFPIQNGGGVLGIRSLVDRRHDPVIQNLLGGNPKEGELIESKVRAAEGKPTILSGLSIDLESRDRVKLSGEMVVGVLASPPGSGAVNGEDASKGDKGEEGKRVVEAQLAIKILESLGNCPKYLNKKSLTPHLPSPSLLWSSPSQQLPAEAVALINKADMFFLSTTDGKTMDTNHRGGPPGFLRLLPSSSVLVYPEYSGNRLYQSLGNLHTLPLIGLAIPDFETSDVLYLTGTAEILIGKDAEAVMPHTKLAVKITVTAGKFVRDGLPFRGEEGERSAYNPPVRRLACEVKHNPLEPSPKATATATLVKKEELTPSVMRFTFSVAPSERGQSWKPGQHVTLDFSAELDNGWAHMNDGDPQSLNDDFVRTFTISNPPPPPVGVQKDGTEMQITARRNGPVTSFLWRQNVLAGLEVPVLGFGGAEEFRISSSSGNKGEKVVFIAGGVGITPLLAQAPSLLEAGIDLEVLWSLRKADLGLAVDSFARIKGLGGRVRVFLTGTSNGGTEGGELLDKVKGLGAKVVERRMEKGDALGTEKEGEKKKKKFYLCASPGMVRVLDGWLVGEEVRSESFEY